MELESILFKHKEQELDDNLKDMMEKKYGHRDWYMVTSYETGSTGLVPKTEFDQQYFKMKGKIKFKTPSGETMYRQGYMRKACYKD